MNFMKKHGQEIVIALFIAVIVILFVAIRDRFGMLSSEGAFEEFIAGFGAWGPIVVILVIILEVIIAPLPGFVPAISAGFIFGTFEGVIITYIGNIIGTFFVFWLARRFGRSILERFFKKERIKKYERLIASRENLLLALYAFPIFPVDIMSGAFGLSRIRFQKFAIAISIGFFLHVLALTFFGDFLSDLYFMM